MAVAKTLLYFAQFFGIRDDFRRDFKLLSVSPLKWRGIFAVFGTGISAVMRITNV
jgi:hypothetical protein